MVVQLYLKDHKGSTDRPLHQLIGFNRVLLPEAG
ncbi:MAG: fibronectin type III-like domain-contianing protein [Bacteroidales bacterium]